MTWTIDGSLALHNLDVIDGNGRICLIECYDDRRSDEELMANARLIAAAPQMRTALDSMVLNYAQSGRVTDEFVRDVARMLLEIDA
jgi:hypothetical protein